MLDKSGARRLSGVGAIAKGVDVHSDHLDGELLALTFTFRSDQREEEVRVTIHPDDFVQIAHQMRGVDQKAFLDTFAKAILIKDYR